MSKGPWLHTLLFEIPVLSIINEVIKSFFKAMRKLMHRERLTTIQKFTILEMNRDYLCRVDPGALVCALHAKGIKIDHEKQSVSFKHSGTVYEMPLLRMKDVKNANGTMMRARVELTFVWNGKTYKNIETSLVDRSKMRYEVLVGRNLIRIIDQPVYISNDETID